MGWVRLRDGSYIWKSTRADLNLDTDDTPTFVNIEVSPIRRVALRPTLMQKATKVAGVPTEVYRGAHVGYSMPIWSSPANSNEELYWRMPMPHRWDGTTDPQMMMLTSLSSAEDVGDYFKFSLEWQSTCSGDVISETTSVCYSEQIVIADRAEAYDAYFLYFTLDADDANNPLTADCSLQTRLRRISATSPDVSNEIIVWDWVVLWPTDKMFGEWLVGSNDT